MPLKIWRKPRWVYLRSVWFRSALFKMKTSPRVLIPRKQLCVCISCIIFKFFFCSLFFRFSIPFFSFASRRLLFFSFFFVRLAYFKFQDESQMYRVQRLLIQNIKNYVAIPCVAEREYFILYLVLALLTHWIHWR